MIIDTDVLIDYFRARPEAEKAILQTPSRHISVVSLCELYQGCRDKKELEHIRHFLRDWKIEIVPIDHEQSYHTLFLMQSFVLSHGLKMADAMIASCALTLKEELLTGNGRDYRFIDELTLVHYRKSRK